MMTKIGIRVYIFKVGLYRVRVEVMLHRGFYRRSNVAGARWCTILQGKHLSFIHFARQYVTKMSKKLSSCVNRLVMAIYFSTLTILSTLFHVQNQSHVHVLCSVKRIPISSSFIDVKDSCIDFAVVMWNTPFFRILNRRRFTYYWIISINHISSVGKMSNFTNFYNCVSNLHLVIMFWLNMPLAVSRVNSWLRFKLTRNSSNSTLNFEEKIEFA